MSPIDDYLSRLPEEQRGALQAVREIVRGAAPGVEECISYQVPAFRLDGKVLVGFGAGKVHCAFYPMSGSTVADFKDRLTGYETTKGSVKFKAEQPLGPDLIKAMVAARIAENRQPAKK
jgi:uncharacterized protein YdhG (YjbR/CyaY superfamily)